MKEATASKDVETSAYSTVMNKRFGENRVMFDPSDPEAGMSAVARGYTLVTGNQLSGGERDNMRRFRADGKDPFQPAGRVWVPSWRVPHWLGSCFPRGMGSRPKQETAPRSPNPASRSSTSTLGDARVPHI